MYPLVRLLLRNGVAFAEFSSMVRNLYVEVADKEFRLDGRKQSLARIAILTGITRREVKKILDTPEGQSANTAEQNRAARVFYGWLHDQEFLSHNKVPKALSIATSGPGTFDALVKKYSGDMPSRAVMDELQRVGAVSKDASGLLSMTSTGYVPSAGNPELLATASVSVGDLIRTIDHNDQSTSENTFLQLAVTYDNISALDSEQFRNISRDRCKKLLLELDQLLGEEDRDRNPHLGGEGRLRTGISMFYFEEDMTSREIC